MRQISHDYFLVTFDWLVGRHSVRSIWYRWRVAILLPPVGIAAVYEYYQHGHVDIRAALIIAIMVLLGSWLGAQFSNQFDTKIIKTMFGVFLVVLGIYVIFDAVKT
jgi:hypothetical protein